MAFVVVVADVADGGGGASRRPPLLLPLPSTVTFDLQVATSTTVVGVGAPQNYIFHKQRCLPRSAGYTTLSVVAAVDQQDRLQLLARVQ